MTPRHESPIAPETTDADAVEPTADGIADDGRQYPGRVRGHLRVPDVGRREDLNEDKAGTGQAKIFRTIGQANRRLSREA